MRNSILVYYLLGIAILFFACNNAKPIETEALILTSKVEGPLFSGINTATAEFNIESILPEGTKPENIKTAKISSIEIKSLVENQAIINAYTVLLASPNQEMTQIAFLNSAEKAVVNLEIAEDQSAVPAILKDQSQTLVVDFDLTEDWFDNWTFELIINWDLTVSQ